MFFAVRAAPPSPEHIMEGHISSAVKSLHLIAHVFKQQLVFVQVHLQPASEQTEQELHPGCRDHALGRRSERSRGSSSLWGHLDLKLKS